MDRDELTRRLRAVFLEELSDHVTTWNAILLRLERGERAAMEADVHSLFRIAHSLKGAARSVSLPELGVYCHGLEEELLVLRESGAAPAPALLERLLVAADVFVEVGERLRASQPLGPELFAPRATPAPSMVPPDPEGAGGLRVPAARLDDLLRRSGELSRATRRLEEREHSTGELMQRLRRLRAGRPVEQREAFDLVLEALGELHVQLVQDVTELGQMARGIDGDVRQLRLTPFRNACQGLERATRDAAKDLGRDVELVVHGGDVEIDRSVLVGLRAPLLHLVRNAVGHGLEAPDARRAAGKTTRGQVRVSASMRGAEVDVEVEDDGRGLDLEALAERARAAGMDPPDDAPGRARLVFVPGLSTAERVDHLSGRGVGLDVVKNEIEALHGSVDVETTRGEGTRFIISAPLTRTVVRAVLLRAGGQLFAIPTTHVETLRRVEPGAVHALEAHPTILHDGKAIAIESLARVLELDEGPRSGLSSPSVIVQAATDRVAFRVDALESVEDVVVEGLGPRLRRVRNIAGAAILGDGELALVLHGGDLVRSAMRARARHERPAFPTLEAPPRARTLLVVDDSLTTLALVKTFLEAAGYRVLAAPDGERALHLLAEVDVDLIVSDVEMPRMSGLELARAIRARQRTAAMPIVLLTGLGRDEDRERGLAAGADAYLVKDAFEQTELLEVVGRLLQAAT